MIWAFLSLIMSVSFASESWFCVDNASKVDGSNVVVCGVGFQAHPANARQEAFTAATNEFIMLCNSSSDCQNHEYTVTPGRMTCETKNNMTTCYRMLTYHIGELKKHWWARMNESRR
ncbi:MAG: hypothetical protein V4493_03085 [Pseudomonadota bacterium]